MALSFPQPLDSLRHGADAYTLFAWPVRSFCLTLFERKHAISSRESFVSTMAETPLLDFEKDCNPLLRRHGLPLASVSLVGFLKALEDADNLLHTVYFKLNSEAPEEFHTQIRYW